MVNVEKMMAQLVLHEALRLRPYVDTEMNWTVGVGYNITSRGWDFFEQIAGRKIAPRDGMTEKASVTRQESLAVLRADILRVEAAITLHWPYYASLDEVRQRVVVDMAFNMGFEVIGFRQAKAAVERRDWSRGARELYKSKWAHQVGDGEGGKFDRCDRLARMLLTGLEPTDIPLLTAA